MVSNQQIRADKKLMEIINFIRAEYIREGKTPPTQAQITKVIANKIKKEELLYDKFA